MRRVVTFIYCDDDACHYRTNTDAPLQFRRKQGWTTTFSKEGEHDYCPEHNPFRIHPTDQELCNGPVQ